MSSILHISNTKGKKLQRPDVRNDFDGNWVQNMLHVRLNVFNHKIGNFHIQINGKITKIPSLHFPQDKIMLSHFSYF